MRCYACSLALDFYERDQVFCRACADAAGIARLCDRRKPEPHETVGEMLVRDGLAHPTCRCDVTPLQLSDIGAELFARSIESPPAPSVALVDLFRGIDRSAFTQPLAGLRLRTPATVDEMREDLREAIETMLKPPRDE